MRDLSAKMKTFLEGSIASDWLTNELQKQEGRK